jgi:hypothetical protein
MCDFISFFVHDRADKLPLEKRYLFGDLRSHSGSMELHGIAYGKPDCWREVEWTDGDARRLTIRAKEPEQLRELTAIILSDFPTRDAAIAHGITRIPANVKTLYLSGCTSLAQLPELANVEWLDLSGCTSLAQLPELGPGVRIVGNPFANA